MGVEYKSLYDRTDLKNRIRSKPISDADGLDKAYKSPNSTFTVGDTLYIAGTKGNFIGGDWLQNYRYIGLPFVTGDRVRVRNTERYKQGHSIKRQYPEGKSVVGHSLGGAVALELKKEYPDLTGCIYGTPYYDQFGFYGKTDGITRYRNLGNPVAMLDNSATTSIQPNPLKYNTLTHDYHDEASQHFQTNVKAIDSSSFANPDSSYYSIGY